MGLSVLGSEYRYYGVHQNQKIKFLDFFKQYNIFQKRPGQEK